MYKNLNAAGIEPAPPRNRPGALTTKPYVLIKLRRNFYTLVTTYVDSITVSRDRTRDQPEINKKIKLLNLCIVITSFYMKIAAYSKPIGYFPWIYNYEI